MIAKVIEKTSLEGAAVNQVSLKEFEEKVASIDRISRTVKGGRRIRFKALVVIGDGQGRVGLGLAKGADVQTAISKARKKAEKSVIKVKIANGTISHSINSTYDKTRVILKPAPEGHSVIAGGVVRQVVSLAGIKNIVGKTLGSTNTVNAARATYQALKRVSSETDR